MKKYAILPYWAYACISALLTLVFFSFMVMLFDGWDSFHHPWIGFGGFFLSFLTLSTYVEYRSRRYMREQINEQPDLYQR